MREKRDRDLVRPTNKYCSWCGSPAGHRSKKHGKRIRVLWKDEEVFVHAELCFMKFVSLHGSEIMLIGKTP